MQIWLQWGFLAFWLGLELKAWATWENLSLHLRQIWEEDYQQLACGQLAALEKNLETGRDFLVRRHPRAAYEMHLKELEEEALAGWQEALSSTCLERPSKGFELYRQVNPELAADYPNWWVHWRVPAHE